MEMLFFPLQFKSIHEEIVKWVFFWGGEGANVARFQTSDVWDSVW
jgi:hypothetical protein